MKERTVFSMYTLVVHTEEDYRQLKDIEKVEAVVVTISQKRIQQLVEGLDIIQLQNKGRRRKIDIRRAEVIENKEDIQKDQDGGPLQMPGQDG